MFTVVCNNVENTQQGKLNLNIPVRNIHLDFFDYGLYSVLCDPSWSSFCFFSGGSSGNLPQCRQLHRADVRHNDACSQPEAYSLYTRQGSADSIQGGSPSVCWKQGPQPADSSEGSQSPSLLILIEVCNKLIHRDFFTPIE